MRLEKTSPTAQKYNIADAQKEKNVISTMKQQSVLFNVLVYEIKIAFRCFYLRIRNFIDGS